MTATMRHDIGLQIADAIEGASPKLLAEFDMKTMSRWAGVRKEPWRCCSFVVRLPGDAAKAYLLAELLDRLRLDESNGTVRRGCNTLYRKVMLGLGLPPYMTEERNAAEAAFLTALDELPGDLATWSAYSDWLQDQDNPDVQRRGRVIAGWLGPKAVKVKYGVPVESTDQHR